MNDFPKRWKLEKFEDLASIGNGQVSPKEEPYLNYYHIGPENVDSETGRISNIKTAKELGLISGKYLFDANAIVYAKIRPNLNKVCLPDFVGICSADMYPIWPKDDIDKGYLYQYMRSYEFLKQTVPASARTGLPKINREDLNKVKILIPPILEQKKISAILEDWDRAVALKERLIATKHKLQIGLIQQLLSGDLRIPSFKKSKRIRIRIGDCLAVVKRPVEWNDDKEYNLISVRRRSGGIFIRGTLTGNAIKTKKMNVVHAGDFILSKMQIVHGATALVTPEFAGMHISDSYITLVEKDKRVLKIEYFNWLSKTPYLYHLAYLSSYGVHIEKMTFNLQDYLKKEIEIPSDVEEQKKIVDILNTSETEIYLLNQELRVLKKQKRGLMQKLLTGDLRVTIRP
jgi:type I restriction enzyme, S subunit